MSKDSAPNCRDARPHLTDAFCRCLTATFRTCLTVRRCVCRSTGDRDEMCVAGAWLFQATGEMDYLASAEKEHETSTAKELSWNDKRAACQVSIASRWRSRCGGTLQRTAGMTEGILEMLFPFLDDSYISLYPSIFYIYIYIFCLLLLFTDTLNMGALKYYNIP